MNKNDVWINGKTSILKAVIIGDYVIIDANMLGRMTSFLTPL